MTGENCGSPVKISEITQQIKKEKIFLNQWKCFAISSIWRWLSTQVTVYDVLCFT